MPTPDQAAVVLITVTTAGTVTADLALTSAGSPRFIATNDALHQFLARRDYHTPPGTPIIRLDMVEPSDVAGVPFAIHGPLASSELPTGTMRLAGAGLRLYGGERWHQLGMTTDVAIDVYVTLAADAGIPIEHVAVPP